MSLTCDQTQVALGKAVEGLNFRPGPGDTVLIEGVPPSSWFSTWQQIREAVPITGRWPVATATVDIISYSEPDWVEPEPSVDDLISDVSPDDVLAFRVAAERAQPWSVFAARTDDFELDPADLEYSMPIARRDHLVEQARQELPAPLTVDSAARWVHERVRNDPSLLDGTHADWLVSEERWYVPDNVTLVLLPTPDSWMSPLWLAFFGALGPELSVALAVVQREWQQRWGAEITASWDTMLQFLVAHPPADSEDAWQLAGQQLAIASNNDESQWLLAAALTRGKHWFLHNRP